MVLVLVLVLSSFLPLPNLNSVEARNRQLSPNGGVFKVDLIHRDSPNSPYYNSSITPKDRLDRWPLGYISRGHNVQLSSTYYNNRSDIIPEDNYGGYLIKFAIGTPKVEFFAIADTGSNLIWVQCSPCESCISNTSSPFDPTKSSTFQAIPCNTPACKKPLLQTSCLLKNTTKSSPCHYQTYYGGGIRSSGILARETISLLSTSSDAASLSLPSLVFGCEINQTVIPTDGIIGLGLGPSSLISQMGSRINYKFSYCLPPLNSEGSGTLAFGAHVKGPGVVSTPFLIKNDSTYYHLTLNGIRLEDDDIQMPPSLDIIIDSGTTITYLPASVYGSIKTAAASAIRLTPVPSPLKGVKALELCYKSGGHINPPEMVFRFEGADVVLRKDNMFWEITKGVTCLAMAASHNFPVIFGNIAQINFHIGYDLKAKLVSFALANCTNYF